MYHKIYFGKYIMGHLGIKCPKISGYSKNTWNMFPQDILRCVNILMQITLR